jgi:hypothetical protein
MLYWWDPSAGFNPSKNVLQVVVACFTPILLHIVGPIMSLGAFACKLIPSGLCMVT